MRARHSHLPWPILELIDQELDPPAPEPTAAPEPIPADAVFMAECDVFLTRDGAGAFTLTLKHRGRVSEIKLTADIDASGAPSLFAFVA